MTETICLNGHTIEAGQDVCARCGAVAAEAIADAPEGEAEVAETTEEAPAEAAEEGNTESESAPAETEPAA